MDDGLLGAGGDDDEVAVPGRELLQRGEQLLALGSALRRAGAAARPRARSARGRRARPRPAPSPRARARGRVEERRCRVAGSNGIGIDAARDLEQRLAAAARLGSSSRSARSSRPPATRASARASVSARPGARSARTARTARSESRRNGTSWQRERIVSGSGPRSSATSTITAYDGGSSRSLSSASAASSFSRSRREMR